VRGAGYTHRMNCKLWIPVAAVTVALACGGKVLESEEDPDATGGSAGTGGSGGSPGTGATGGVPGTGGTGGSPGTGGSSTGGTGGGPSALVSSCLGYIDMALSSDETCSSCFGNALSGSCAHVIDPLLSESGPCGEVNACANEECGDGLPGQLCLCLEKCMGAGPASCETRWTQAFQCLIQACSGACG
jgi:hypothetical protein